MFAPAEKKLASLTYWVIKREYKRILYLSESIKTARTFVLSEMFINVFKSEKRAISVRVWNVLIKGDRASAN